MILPSSQAGTLSRLHSIYNTVTFLDCIVNNLKSRMHVDLIKSVSVTLDHSWPLNARAHFTTNKRVDWVCRFTASRVSETRRRTDISCDHVIVIRLLHRTGWKRKKSADKIFDLTNECTLYFATHSVRDRSLPSSAHTLLNLSTGPPRLIKCLYAHQVLYGLHLLFSCTESVALVRQNTVALLGLPLTMWPPTVYLLLFCNSLHTL